MAAAPKLPSGISVDVQKFDAADLKKTEVHEKHNVIADLARDQTMTAIDQFDKTGQLKKSGNPKEMDLRDQAVTELARDSAIKKLGNFEKGKLKKTVSREIDPLTVVVGELARDSAIKEVGSFEKSNLKKTVSREIDPSTIVAQETAKLKIFEKVGSFDKSELKKAETVVTNEPIQ